MSAYTLVIGTKNWSSWSLRPWILMRVAGIAFDEVEIPLRSDTTKAEILAHSPSGQVPALKEDGALLAWDSLAICELLAERHPDRVLWPADPSDRAQARSISAEMHAGFRALREQMPMDILGHVSGVTPTADTARDIARILEIWQTCRGRKPAGGPFLFGAFSIADAMYAPVVSRFATYGVVLPPAAEAYANAVTALPAMAAWREACEAGAGHPAKTLSPRS